MIYFVNNGLFVVVSKSLVVCFMWPRSRVIDDVSKTLRQEPSKQARPLVSYQSKPIGRFVGMIVGAQVCHRWQLTEL